MAKPAVSNPLFARLYARVLAPNEPAEMRDLRIETLRGLSGRVVELGAGAGTNFPLYPDTVTEVVAVEPEPYLREQATRAAAEAAVKVKVTVVDGTADRLPLEDGSCDAAVACLVLCSVPSQATALAELHRVVRPNGELRFFEHVRSDAQRMATLQRWVDRLFWPRAFGGCHTHRETGPAIEAAGFAIESQRRRRSTAKGVAPPVATQLIGVARRTG